MEERIFEDVSINLLTSEYTKHCSEALNCAMSEIYALEMPMHIYSTLGCITKDTYYKTLCYFKRKLQDSITNDKTEYVSFIVGLIDTLTCMVHQWTFFEEYRHNIKHLLIVTVHCLQMLQGYCNSKDANGDQVEKLLNFIKKFISRIKDHEQLDTQMNLNLTSLVESLTLTRDLKFIKEKSQGNNANKKANHKNMSYHSNDDFSLEKTHLNNLKNKSIRDENDNEKVDKKSLSDVTNHGFAGKKDEESLYLKSPNLKHNVTRAEENLKTTRKKFNGTHVNYPDKSVNAFAFMMANSKKVLKLKKK